jgi:hypothetical protein
MGGADRHLRCQDSAAAVRAANRRNRVLGRSHSPYHVQADTWDRAMLAMDRKQLEHLSHHPLRLLHEVWQWEWHALIIWGVVAAIAMPLLAVYLRRALVCRCGGTKRCCAPGPQCTDVPR